MTSAILAFIHAQTQPDLIAAYSALLEWSDAPEGLERDDVDNMLNSLGLPSMATRMAELHD